MSLAVPVFVETVARCSSCVQTYNTHIPIYYLHSNLFYARNTQPKIVNRKHTATMLAKILNRKHLTFPKTHSLFFLLPTVCFASCPLYLSVRSIVMATTKSLTYCKLSQAKSLSKYVHDMLKKIL